MPWARIDENAGDHPKIASLSDGAFRLWVTGLLYCQRFLTDGFITSVALRGLRAHSAKRVTELVEVGLWELADGGVRVHDYLQWNDSRAHILENRDWGKRRREMYSDPALLASIRQRDGDCCRYCGKVVNWRDRRGPDGGTYDHVVARGPNTYDNVVVACRGCNASKGDRPLETSGMCLRSVPDLDRNQKKPNTHISGVGDLRSALPERGVGKTPPRDPSPSEVPDDVALRAGRFCQETYPTLYEKHRRGARYVGRPALDFQEALQLCQTWDDERLAKIATVFLTTDHQFAENGSRTMAQFRSMASWCDGKLRESGL
jgi:5-methylcytosine-specific restriction endonuclease McrA